MTRLRALCAAVCLGLAAPAAWAADPLLVIHGGAGLERKDVTPQDEAAIRAALTLALKKGHEALAAGKPALDAVTAAITRARGRPAVQRRQGRRVHPRRQERARCLDHGRRHAARRRGGRCAPGEEPDPAGARGDGAFAARDDGRRRCGDVRAGTGDRAGRSVVFPHRAALAAAAEGVEGRRRRGQAMRDPSHGPGISARSARSRCDARASSPRAPPPAA